MWSLFHWFTIQMLDVIAKKLRGLQSQLWLHCAPVPLTSPQSPASPTFAIQAWIPPLAPPSSPSLRPESASPWDWHLWGLSLTPLLDILEYSEDSLSPASPCGLWANDLCGGVDGQCSLADLLPSLRANQLYQGTRLKSNVPVNTSPRVYFWAVQLKA